MKSPICEICLKSSILCSACQEKLSQGELTNKDIDILTLLYKESEKNKALSNIEVKKIITSNDIVLIVCNSGNAAKIVGRGGFFVKRLQDIAKKPVRVVEESDDPRKFLQNILLPVPIINLNVLYTPRGDKYRIVIPRDSRLPMPLKTFISLANDLLKKEVEVAFDGRTEKKETIEDKIHRLVKGMKR